MYSLKKYLIAAITIIVVTAFIHFYKEYHRKPASVLSMQTAAYIDALELIHAFTTDEASANNIYLGKTIEVKGAVLEVLNQTDTLMNIFLGEPGPLNKVSCLMDAEYFKKHIQIKTGSIHIIKGICTGFLMDVELTRCVIIK